MATITLIGVGVVVGLRWQQFEKTRQTLFATSVLGKSKADAMDVLSAIEGVKCHDSGDTVIADRKRDGGFVKTAVAKVLHIRDGKVVDEENKTWNTAW